MQEAEDKFGKKGKTNAALTLGIIGTALGAFSGNNGILGGLFGGNNGNCCCKSEKQLLVAAGDLQRQLDHKITGQLKYAYSDLCAPAA